MIEHLSRYLPDNPMNLWFLLLFVLIFAGVLFWTIRPSRKAELDERGRLPLND